MNISNITLAVTVIVTVCVIAYLVVEQTKEKKDLKERLNRCEKGFKPSLN